MRRRKMLSDTELIKCKNDIGYFSKAVLNIKLWSHQLEFLTCSKKIVVIASARQIGKSTACAVKAIHTAFSKKSKVLVVSPSLRQSGLMFATIRQMIGESFYLRASLIDDTKTYIKLSNGSELWCLPDSPAQIRGFSGVSVVIIDEANFCSQELLRAVQYSLLTVKDSQLFMISSPWATEHWFYRYYQDGQTHRDTNVASFHYTYESSPLIEKAYIERLKDKITEEEYKTEILGEWISDEDAYFDYELIESCVADYRLINSEEAQNELVWAGVDWASRGSDATVIMFISVVDLDDTIQIYVVPYFEAYRKTDYIEIINRIIELRSNFHIMKIISETNGIGDMPTQMLIKGGLNVEGLFTTAQSKINGYGRMKILMQSGQLILPREPELIKQLTNLRYTISESGASMSIAHSKQYQKDDYCDALMFAILACQDYPLSNNKNDITLVKSKLKQNTPDWRRYSFHWPDNDDNFRPITAGLLDKKF